MKMRLRCYIMKHIRICEQDTAPHAGRCFACDEAKVQALVVALKNECVTETERV